jgi:hypothetical protein
MLAKGITPEMNNSAAATFPAEFLRIAVVRRSEGPGVEHTAS